MGYSAAILLPIARAGKACDSKARPPAVASPSENGKPIRLRQRILLSDRDPDAAPSPNPAAACATYAEELRRPCPTPLEPRERTGEALASLAFLVVATILALRVAPTREFDAGPAVLLLLAYVACARVRFFAGAGYTTPAQVVFVAMLFILPLGLVPLAVAAGLLLAGLPRIIRRELPPDRLLVIPADAWYSVGPVLVLAAAGGPAPGLVHWPVLAAALAAQFVGDLVVSLVRERIAYGVPPRLQLRVLGWIWMVDGLLAPLGLLAAMASAHQPYAFALALPLFGLIAVFARERNTRITHALELTSTYRGTALLLGDLLERSDAYTGGQHTAGVVELSAEVAEELGFDAAQRRRVELAAMLHDVGKMAMPASIITKPGPLDAEEWAIMRTHTLEGQRMLDRVGGALADIGQIVRSSHERFDGGGYPDGLTGTQTPLEASVVSTCDAFDAMTTDRPYRRAGSPTSALAELRAESGHQFSPEVVEAVERVVTRRLKRAHPENGHAHPLIDWSAAPMPPYSPLPPPPPLPDAAVAGPERTSLRT